MVPRSISITNTETLSYLTAAFRNARTDLTEGVAWVCRGYITLSNGKAVDVTLVFCESNGMPRSIDVGIAQGFLKDEKFYAVLLSAPKPKELLDGIATMMGRMNRVVEAERGRNN